MLLESPGRRRSCAPPPREAYLRDHARRPRDAPHRHDGSVQDDAFLMPAPEPDIIDAVMQAYRRLRHPGSASPLDQPELAEAEKLPFLAELADTGLRAALDAPGAR